MECSCTVYCDLDSDIDYHCKPFIKNDSHKSPRERDCDECREVIAPGEPHFCETYRSYPELELDRYRRCSDCTQIATVFFNDYFIGEIWESLKDAILDGEIGVSESCLVGLSKNNMERVCEIIERLWRHQEDDDAE